MYTDLLILTLVSLITFGLGYYVALSKIPRKRSEELYSGEETKEEKEMLKSVLDLSDIEVYDVMNHRKNLFSIDIDLPIEDIIEKIKASPFSRVPFYQKEPDNIVGILRVRELLKKVVSSGGDLSAININELMVKPWFILETTNLMEQLQLFRARREHFAIVVNEYGDLEGIVTLEDIIEEIVGDINDEYDTNSIDLVGIQESGDSKTLFIDGDVPVRDLNRKYSWNLCDENAVTLAGYLMDMTQSIPEQGQSFIFEGFEFKIIKRNKNQLKRVRVRPEKKI